jgi:hypothetical protein
VLAVLLSFSNAANDGIDRARKILRSRMGDLPDFVSREHPLGGFDDIQAGSIIGSTPALMINRR